MIESFLQYLIRRPSDSLLCPQMERTVRDRITADLSSGKISFWHFEICKAAGVTNGSFYHHFGSKDEVLSKYLMEAFDRRAEEFEQITGENVVANILKYHSLYNAFLLDLGLEFVRNFYSNTNKGLYSHRNYLLGQTRSSPLMQAIDRILRQAKENGYLTENCDISLLTYDMSVLEKGVLFDWCLANGEYDLDKQMTRILRNYLLRTVISDKYLKEFPVYNFNFGE